jgi:predicted dehydrogenase
MRIIAIGVGHHHTPLYLRPVLAMAEHRVVGLSDPDPEVARRAAEPIGCAWSGDYRELIRAERPDFVFALGRHCDMAEEAEFLIDEGIPFAIEKPAGLNAAEVGRLADKAARRGAFAAPCLVMRYNDLAELLRRELGEDRLDYVLFRWFSGRTHRYEIPTSRWLLDPKQAGGGCLIHLGVHHLDWFRWLVGGRPVAVRSALIANRAEGRAVEDYSLVAVEADGIVGVLETGYLRPDAAGAAGPFEMHYLIRTDRHHVSVREAGSVEVVALGSGRARSVAGSTTNAGTPTAAFCADILARARAGRAPVADLWDMAEVMRMVDAAYALAGPLPVRRPS